MSSLGQYLKDVLGGAASLAAGLGVTIRYMFKPVVTEQYPRVRLKIPEAFRGHVELEIDEATKDHLCIACGMCANACPSAVITVVAPKKKPAPAAKKDEPKKAEGEAKEPKERSRPDKFSIDFSRCSLCGLCVETCPKGALRFSHVYEQAGPTREAAAVVDLLLRHKAMVQAGCGLRTTTQQQAA